jgi:putative transposase
VVERNVQRDHIRPVGMIPPKVSISDFMGRLKGQTSMKLFHEFRHLRKKPYGGNHFWAKGSCVDTIGLDAASPFLRRRPWPSPQNSSVEPAG